MSGYRKLALASLFYALALAAGDASGQERKFLGRVVDEETQKPLKNVNIIVAGTASGVTSNYLGFFEITVDPTQHGMLVASHVGYATSEVPVPAEEKFKFALTKVYQPLTDLVLADHPKEYRPVDSRAPTNAGGISAVESNAVFPGGMDNFRAFMGNKLAIEPMEMTGNEIVVLFTVNESGKAVNMIFPDSTDTFNRRVAAALESMPAWTPATQRQVSVPQGFILKIRKKRGDLKPFTDFVVSKANYPADARRSGYEGPVLVEFSVDSAGVISNIKKVADIGGGCGDEVVRVLGTTPAKVALALREGTGHTTFLLPVHFGLENPFMAPVPNYKPNVYVLQPAYLTAIGVVREKKVMGNPTGYPIGWSAPDNSSTKIRVRGVIQAAPTSLKAALNDKKGTARLNLVNQGLETFPVDILKLTNLKVLDLEQNQISALPEEIVALKKMQELYLFQNKLERLPEGLAQLTDMETLGLGENQLTSLPEQVTSLRSLKALDLSGNKITAIPAGIRKLQELKVLLLRDNQIPDIPEELFELKNLTTLDLSGNPLDSLELDRVKNAMPNTTVITYFVGSDLAATAVEEETFTIVEESAFPLGGMGAFYQYVMKEMKYPPYARKMGIDGKVFLEFVVNKNGSISDVRVVKGIGGGCDEEALRVVRSAPPWNPGMQRGKPIRQRMVLPITFKLG